MNRLKIDELSKVLIIGLVFSQYFLLNGFYLFLPIIISVILFYYLQQPYKCSIFVIILFWHCIQIYAAPLLCDYLGNGIDDKTPNTSTAVILSSIGLIPLFIPAIWVQNKFPNQTLESLKKSVETFSINKVMYAYIVSFFLYTLLGSIAFLFGGLTQIIFWIVDIKWILFSLFGFLCIFRNEKKKLFYLFAVIEFITGFYSFFSDFKTVIFFVFILFITLVEEIDISLFIKAIILSAVLIAFGLIWTNIKGEYRSFLNGGAESQEVTVSSNEALDKIYSLTNESLNDNSEKDGSTVSNFLDRIQYMYFFSKTIDRIPNVIPYQNGSNWLDNLEFTTTPRFFNPDKPVLDQSEKVKRYTGLQVAGKNKGVSFSLGYFAECYLDFGPKGMMFFLLLIGLMYAKFYDYLLRQSSRYVVFNYCVAAAFFNEFSHNEMDGTYLLGRFFSGVLTFYLLIKFVFPILINYFTTEEKLDTLSK
jgi:hypothetical protein